MSVSNHVFTQWSILDPALMRKQIETALDETIFDTASALSDERMQAQINTATGQNVFFPLSSRGPLSPGIKDTQWTPDSLASAMGLDTSP